MTPTFFQTPVVVFGATPKATQIITTVGEAADFLFDHWSGHDSKKWTDAMSSCDTAETGASSITGARMAFIMALQAVGMQVDRTITLH